jgi:hypothetical protein
MNLKVAATKKAEPATGEEVLGRTLLQSIHEMKARNFARTTEAARISV